MKKVLNLLSLGLLVAIVASCTKDNVDEWSNTGISQFAAGSTNGPSAAASSSSELTSFVVNIDSTTAEPTTSCAEYFPEEEDNPDNNSFSNDVTIHFNGTTATCSVSDYVTITKNGAHIVANHGDNKGVNYIVSGTTTDGSLTIIGNKKYQLTLNGVSITNPDSTALNLLSRKRAFILLATGTQNTIIDGTASKADDQKGAFYCKGKMLFDGSGSLRVTGQYNNGIHCADYIIFRSGNNVYVKSTANHGIKANDGIYINGGILNVEVSAEAAKGINCENEIIVNGGRTTVITTGEGAYEDSEAKGAAAVKADTTFVMNGGELWLKSTGAGGKAIKADYYGTVNGGSIYAITEGGIYSKSGDTSSPKGIKTGNSSFGDLTVNGGTVMVRTKGQKGEGIESKGTITFNDGIIKVSAYDDGINASSHLYVKGGTITAVGQNSDGMDANGNMYISGGQTVAFGAGGAESGIDVGEQNKLYVTGGNLFGMGGRIDASYATSGDVQPYASATASVSANTTVTVANDSKTLATFAMPPYSFSNGTIMVSVTGMQSGSTYRLNTGSTSQTVTATTSSSGSMGGGGMPRGGGRW